jgi:hypothetical protein
MLPEGRQPLSPEVELFGHPGELILRHGTTEGQSGHLEATFASRARERGDHEEAVRWEAVLATVGAILRPDGPPFELFGGDE